MASRNKSKSSSGLRMLWIPGGRKNHSSKGRFDSTNKGVSGYGPKQKKSEVWSLGGRRTQTDLLFAEPDTRLLDGPTSTARLVPPIAGTVGAAAAGVAGVEHHRIVEVTTKREEEVEESVASSSPSSPSSSSSTITTTTTTTTITTDLDTTAPVPINTSTPNSTETSSPTMPGKTINTTNAEIMDDNRFAILGKEILHEDFDINDLPSPPSGPIILQQNQAILLNTSSDTATTKTAATTTMPSSPQSDTGESNRDNNSTQSNKKLNHHRNHNNNNNKQSDINSIESISDNNIPSTIIKPLNTDLTWIDDLYQTRQDNKVQERNKRKKKKKHANAKKMDQLDGVPNKQTTASEASTDEDEKVVKCLYYTLMCCDCTIS